MTTPPNRRTRDEDSTGLRGTCIECGAAIDDTQTRCNGATCRARERGLQAAGVRMWVFCEECGAARGFDAGSLAGVEHCAMCGSIRRERRPATPCSECNRPRRGEGEACVCVNATGQVVGDIDLRRTFVERAVAWSGRRHEQSRPLQTRNSCFGCGFLLVDSRGYCTNPDCEVGWTASRWLTRHRGSTRLARRAGSLPHIRAIVARLHEIARSTCDSLSGIAIAFRHLGVAAGGAVRSCREFGSALHALEAAATTERRGGEGRSPTFIDCPRCGHALFASHGIEPRTESGGAIHSRGRCDDTLRQRFPAHTVNIRGEAPSSADWADAAALALAEGRADPHQRAALDVGGENREFVGNAIDAPEGDPVNCRSRMIGVDVASGRSEHVHVEVADRSIVADTFEAEEVADIDWSGLAALPPARRARAVAEAGARASREEADRAIAEGALERAAPAHGPLSRNDRNRPEGAASSAAVLGRGGASHRSNDLTVEALEAAARSIAGPRRDRRGRFIGLGSAENPYGEEISPISSEPLDVSGHPPYIGGMTREANNPEGTTMTSLKDIRFGIEIEVKGTIDSMLTAVLEVVGGTAIRTGYRRHVLAADGRKWMVVTDASVPGGCEFVSPICTYTDIETIQEITRSMRRHGARVDRDCGVHIHLDGAKFEAKSVRNLIKITAKQERHILAALGAEHRSAGTWCAPIDQAFLTRLENNRHGSMREITENWYTNNSRHDSNRNHTYNSTRYNGVNLHSLFLRGTIELRWFNSTLHAGKVKSWIQFSLALAARAINTKQSSGKRLEWNAAKAKWVFRNFLNRIGLRGEEFKTCRHHMLSNLSGSAAYQGTRGDTARAATTQNGAS